MLHLIDTASGFALSKLWQMWSQGLHGLGSDKLLS